MSAGRIIAYIAAAILIFFGVLFLWGSGASAQGATWIIIGAVSIGAGFGVIWFSSRKDVAKTELIQKIELSGDIELETLTCRNCGGTLTSDNVKMIAGAPLVSCPYCNTSYQLSEEPKW